MARSGEGLRLRGRTWWLDFRHEGERYQIRLGSGISRTVARELAQVQRSRVLKGEVGIARKKRDIAFGEAVQLLLEWARANKKPLTVIFYRDCFARLGGTFRGKRLSTVTRKFGDVSCHGQAARAKRDSCLASLSRRSAKSLRVNFH